MIRHDFICEECEHIERDKLCSPSDLKKTSPRHCGKVMDIHYNDINVASAEFVSFTTRNIHPDGKPLLVRNRGDLQRYYREYGVIHVDDPDLEAVGSEIRRKAPKIGKVFDMGSRR